MLQVEGGKYADPAAECQVFHFCALGDTEGGLLTYSFLCPNGSAGLSLGWRCTT